MGIFDVIEMQQHLRSVTEYLLYLEDESRRLNDWTSVSRFIDQHLASIKKILDSYEK